MSKQPKPTTSFEAILHYDFRTGDPLDPVIAANALIGYSRLLDAAHVILRQTYPALEGTEFRQNFVDLEEGSLTGKVVVWISGDSLGSIFTKRDDRGEPQMRSGKLFGTTVGALVLSSCLNYNRAPDTSETLGGEALQDRLEAELEELHRQEDAEDQDLKRLKRLLEEPSKLSAEVNKILAPAKLRSSGVSFDTSGSAFIPTQIAYNLPSARDMPDFPEVEEVLAEVAVEIRASDYDQRRSWAAKVPSVSDQRLKLKIDKAIVPQNLAGVTKLVGRVRVTYRIDYNKSRVPIRYQLLAIVDKQEKKSSENERTVADYLRSSKEERY